MILINLINEHSITLILLLDIGKNKEDIAERLKKSNC